MTHSFRHVSILDGPKLLAQMTFARWHFTLITITSKPIMPSTLGFPEMGKDGQALDLRGLPRACTPKGEELGTQGSQARFVSAQQRMAAVPRLVEARSSPA